MAKQGPKDINTLAFSIVEELTADAPPEPMAEKRPEAVARGKKGGAARAEKLSSEKRKAIAKKGANVRWQREEGDGDRPISS